VSTGAKIAIAVGALAVAKWIAWPDLEETKESAPTAAVEVPPSLEPVPDIGPTREEPPPARTPALAAEAPEAAEKLSPEPSEAECEKMEELVDARTLSGIVLRGREPVSGGRAYLAHGNRFVPKDPEQHWVGVVSWMPQSGEEERFRNPIGRDGRFAFEGLQPDWYTLAIDVGGGTCRQMVFNLMRGARPARSIVIVLGTASVVGHVYDDQGRPIADARIVATAEVVRNQELRGFARTAWTDARGAYELPELSAGKYHVSMRRDGLGDDPNFDVSLEASVEIGERRVVDFGRPRALPRWDGIVRARTGEPAAGGGRIELEEVREGRKFEATYDARGVFAVALLPGRYAARVRAVGDPMRKIELGEFDVPEGGLVQDLVLPGTRIRGIALDWRTGSPWGGDGSYHISLRPIDQDWPGAFTDAEIGEGGVFVFDGVGPGTWVLGGHPLDIVSAPDDRVELTIREGELEVPLTVTIGLREK
jgi:hypothetical protein